MRIRIIIHIDSSTSHSKRELDVYWEVGSQHGGMRTGREWEGGSTFIV